MNDYSSVLLTLIALVGGVSLLPFVAVAVTSFAKVTVVLLIVRNALSVQQTPPNSVIYGIAMILTFFIMAPPLRDMYVTASQSVGSLNSVAQFERLVQELLLPLKAFMGRYTEDRSQDFFIEALGKIWPDSSVPAGRGDMVILVPAFMSDELRRAFEIGFILYIPFLMIDIVVSAILIVVGLQSMSPTVVSTPLKLLLFVAVDGWHRLLQGLVLSYAP